MADNQQANQIVSTKSCNYQVDQSLKSKVEMHNDTFVLARQQKYTSANTNIEPHAYKKK